MGKPATIKTGSGHHVIVLKYGVFAVTTERHATYLDFQLNKKYHATNDFHNSVTKPHANQIEK